MSQPYGFFTWWVLVKEAGGSGHFGRFILASWIVCTFCKSNLEELKIVFSSDSWIPWDCVALWVYLETLLSGWSWKVALELAWIVVWVFICLMALTWALTHTELDGSSSTEGSQRVLPHLLIHWSCWLQNVITGV